MLKFSPPRALYFFIFAISGFSGLIYESIWSHYLKLFLGHAAYAQSLVLIIFMGGMAIGSWLTARNSTRWHRPVVVYAVVELIVGIVAIFFHDLFTQVTQIFFSGVLPSIESVTLGNSLKWLVAGAIILPQSILLGMTFPLMSAAIIRRYPKAPGGTLATLYFSNSIGAAIGVLVSGFWMIGQFGLPGTIKIAGLLNIALAVAVILLVVLDKEPPGRPAYEPANGRSSLAWLFLFAAFVTGAASFIYEIAWLRMLSLVLGSTTHSFELMLSAFIAGLAFGGLWIRRRIDRIRSPLVFSAFVQILMGTFALLTIPVYILTFDWMTHIIASLAKSNEGFVMFTLMRSVISFAVMLPATFFAGMTLPLFTYVLMQRTSGEKAIGRVYAANTFGAIAGVLFAVHVGLPILGVKYLIGFGAGLDLILGLALMLYAGRRLRFLQVMAAFVIIAIGLGVHYKANLTSQLLASGVYRHGMLDSVELTSVLYYKDGKTASIALSAWADQTLVLTSNGKPDAAIKEFPDGMATNDAITMTMAGALPFAYHPQARHIANIGMGSGLTTHTLLTNPSVEQVDTIEIEQSVIEASKIIGFRVRRAYNDERSKIHIEDAKTYFSLNNKKYDVIVAEPSNPWVSGVASLFTHEFYQSVGKYINQDGLFVQWLQMYEFNDQLFLSILAALNNSFDDYVIYHADNMNLLIVAKPHGMLAEPDFSSLFVGNMKKEMNYVELYNEQDILVRKSTTRKLMSGLIAQTDIPVNSDYYPFVDLNAGRARYLGTTSEFLPTLPVLPLPLLEMLQGEKIAFKDISPNVRFTRSVNIVRAKNIFHAVLRTPADVAEQAGAGGVSFSDARDIAAVTLGNSDCFASMPGALWLATAHGLIEATLSYLSPDDATTLLDAFIDDECLNQQSPDFISKWALYHAVAKRNAPVMTQLAKQLLPEMVAEDDAITRYVFTAGLLGAVAHHNTSAAQQLWDEHARFVFNMGQPLPPDIMLLRSDFAL